MDADRISDEKLRIREIVRRVFEGVTRSVAVRSGNSRLLTGVAEGDDAAVYRCEGSFDLVVASDYVRGPKFILYELGYLELRDLGRYLAIANLSDIAGMGASPIGFLSVVRYPSEMTDEDLEEVLLGIEEGCLQVGCPVVGGDLGSAERLFLSGTALGICDPGTALLRSGATPGDHLYVTEPVGVAGAAVLLLSDLTRAQGLEPALMLSLLEAWKRPRAQVPLGEGLARGNLASSCQDISDGVLATLEEIGEASDVGFVVEESAFPVADPVAHAAQEFGFDPISLACSASVDFGLCFTVPSERTAHVDDLLRQLAVNGRRIGMATSTPGIQLRRHSGTFEALRGVSWRHRSEDVADLAREMRGTIMGQGD